MLSAFKLLTLLLLAWPATLRGSEAPKTVTPIPPGSEGRVTALIARPGFGVHLPGGYGFFDADIAVDTIVYTLSRVSDGGGRIPSGKLILRPRAQARIGDRQTVSFDAAIELIEADPLIKRYLDEALESVVASDRSDFYSAAKPASAGSSPRHRQVVGCFVVLAGALLLLLARDLRRLRQIELVVGLKLTHVLPALLQLVLLLYWSLYWHEVATHLVRDIPPQLAFAYAFDLLLGWARRRRLTIGFGPIPIVLSTNLFIWFPDPAFYLYFVIIVVAVTTKSLLVRDGRPIFNPSGIGISTVAILCLVWQARFPNTDIAHQLALPPNMLELIFLLALIPQLRLKTTVVTIGAFAMMLAARSLWPMTHLPAPMWPAWLLSITLFAGDPATIPRSQAGRFLFGAFVGAGIELSSFLLQRFAGTDYFAKVLPIPFANLLVPLFDRVAPGAIHRLNVNALATAAWVVLFLGRVPDAKAAIFEPRWQSELSAAPLTRGPGGLTCEDNPIYCTPFSFAGEARQWRYQPRHERW